MSNAVRGTSGAQGSGGVAAGGGSSASRGAPTDGASFGGVLGAAMSEPKAAHGTTDGKGNDTGDGKGNNRQPSSSADATTIVGADLTPAAGSALSATAAASGSGGGLTGPSTGTTPRGDKKRPADATTSGTPSAAQLAVAVAATAVPASGVSAAQAGGANTAAVAGAAKALGTTGGPPASGAAATAFASTPPSPTASGAITPNGYELVGPEDGSGPREPDGIDPATATVGRPAAMVSGGSTALLPTGASTANADPASADTASTSASGSPDQPLAASVAAGAPSSTALASTTVFAVLAPGERDPNRTLPTTVGSVTASAPIAATASPAGNAIASTLLGAAPAADPARAAATGVNVVAPDGTSQPLANALGSQVLAMVAAGRSQVTVHLNPPDLGALTVRVEVQSRDVSAWFASPQPQVQQAVSDALAQLHGALGSAGLNLSGAWVGADVSGGNGRPAATPLPMRRAPVAAVGADSVAPGATPAEGLSVYA